MSFLYPLFLAGLATIGLPILLHMIRRYTRKRVTFSSLMFLRTTVPRWRNRGRLENLPLLVLRCVMLGLLAFGFSRPFFLRPSAQNEAFADLGRRIVLLIDTSASMRRAGLFPRAVSEAQSLLQSVRAADRVCVMSFDQSTRRVFGFEEWATLDPAQRASIAIEHISKLSPSWARTNLGHALVTAAETIQEDETENFQFPISNFQFNRVVLISDLQQGSFLDELQAYQWPKDIELVVKPIAAKGTTNVSMQLVTSRDLLVHPAEGANRKSPIVNGKSQMAISDKRFAISDAAGVPIRITNSPDATKERFKLSWVDTSNQKFEIRNSKFEISDDVYVPAGHSTVVRVPLPADMAAGGRLILTGDDHDFDNNLYLAPYCQQQVNILYVGTDDVNDPQGMLYYVKRAFDGLTASKVRSSEFGVRSLFPVLPFRRLTIFSVQTLRQYLWLF